MLVYLLGFLAFVRFFMVPWLAFQDEERDSLLRKTRQLDRAVALSNSKSAIESSHNLLTNIYARSRAQFPKFIDESQFRLSAQRQIGGLAVQCGVVVGVFDWVTGLDKSKSGIQGATAKMQVTGSIHDLAVFHAKLEAENPGIVIRQLSFSSSMPFQNVGASAGSMIILANFYFVEK